MLGDPRPHSDQVPRCEHPQNWFGTRAYDSGRLTALEVEGRRMRIIQAVGPARRPGSSELEG